MAKGKKKVLVIGKLRIRLPDRVSQLIMGAGTGLKDRASPLVRRKVQLGRFNVPIVFFLVAILAILPIGMVFGAGEPTPSGRNLLDPANPKITIENINFYYGQPSDPGDPVPIPNMTYSDGTEIEDGNFWLFFEWGMIDYSESIYQGDYFDLVLDLGLDALPAVVAEQVGTFAPVIYAKDSSEVGTIKWINSTTYMHEARIIIRFVFDKPGFVELPGDGTLEGRVNGTGVWGFMYDCSGYYETEVTVTWQFLGYDGWPGGKFKVKPKPPGGKPPGGDEYYLPYAKFEKGYKKFGKRLTPDNTPLGDTIFYWNIMINGHKHNSIAEWTSCDHNTKTTPPYNNYSDPPPSVVGDAFTVVDQWNNMAMTWLRNVVETNSRAVIQPANGLTVHQGGGLYGNTKEATTGPAYVKLFYVNTAYIWNDRINFEGSKFKTLDTDLNPDHHPSTGNPVGKYDPMYTTWYLEEGEANAVLYAPNYRGSGEKYFNYLTPVPASDVKAIRVTENGLEVEMYTASLFNPGQTLGKTLAIAYMTKPVPNAQGHYSSHVGNMVKMGHTSQTWVATCSGEVLIGGTVDGRPPQSPNKGKFILEKRNHNTNEAMAGVVFEIEASSDDEEFAEAVNGVIENMIANNTPPGSALRTDANGLIVIDLRAPTFPYPFPWPADLLLKITETEPNGFQGVREFTVTVDKTTGMVKNKSFTRSADAAYVDNLDDNYGVLVWNRYGPPGDYYDVALRKWIKKVDRPLNSAMYNIYYKDEVNSDIVNVRNGDVILYRIDVYNQCFNNVIIPSLSDWLPPGLKFDPAAKIAHDGMTLANDPSPYDNSLWELASDTGDGSSYASPVKLTYKGPQIELPAWEGPPAAYPEGRLWLVLTVDVPDSDDLDEDLMLSNVARITKLLNEDGEEVEDIDSFIDDDRDNTGPVPGVDADPQPGVVIDNDIEGKRKRPDKTPDYTQDEDTHDYAPVVIRKAISCEVFKDTIKRTSAAFNGTAMDVRIDGGVINNVGIEQYRYDVDFRSTASWDSDEFVVDDPLENVRDNLVRITGLWTPATWGDLDGRFSVWYKTKNNSGGSASPPAVPITAKPVANQKYPTLASDGWKLWTTIDQSAAPLYTSTGVIDRVILDIDDLGLAAGDYITALRFEYGGVAVGFTSRNTEKKCQNGVYRTAGGVIVMDPEDLARLEPFGASALAALAVAVEPNSADEFGVGGPDDTVDASGGNFFTKLVDFFTGSSKKNNNSSGDGGTAETTGLTGEMIAAQDYTPIEVFGIGGPDPFGDQATVPAPVFSDWTPDPLRSDYSPGAASAEGLLPISYMVECTKAMEDVNIVSSAISRIALANRVDDDVDAVLTREIVPFTLDEDDDSEYTLDSEFNDDIPRLTPNTEEGAGGKTGGGGSSSRTFDEMNPLFWIGMAAAALAAAGLVFLLWSRYKRRMMIAAARAGRRRSI